MSKINKPHELESNGEDFDLQNINLEDAKPEVRYRNEVKLRHTMSAPKVLATIEQAQEQVLEFDAYYWKAAELKRMGWSLNRIHQHFNGRFSLTEITYMIQKVINVNMVLCRKDTDTLRHQMIMELEQLEEMVWDGAAISSTTSRAMLDDKQVRVLLSIKDRKILLLGLNAPQEIKVDVTQTIEDAREKILDSYERYERKKTTVIDVTPTAEPDKQLKEAQPISSTYPIQEDK